MRKAINFFTTENTEKKRTHVEHRGFKCCFKKEMGRRLTQMNRIKKCFVILEIKGSEWCGLLTACCSLLPNTRRYYA
jgi:hypothetical protein